MFGKKNKKIEKDDEMFYGSQKMPYPQSSPGIEFKTGKPRPPSSDGS